MNTQPQPQSSSAQRPAYPSISKTNDFSFPAREDKRKFVPLKQWPDFPRATKEEAQIIQDIRDPSGYIQNRPRPKYQHSGTGGSITYVRKQ
jgi:hypothetical protein